MFIYHAKSRFIDVSDDMHELSYLVRSTNFLSPEFINHLHVLK